MTFKKGQSGNPGGRPKENKQLKALAREHAELAIARLIALMTGDDSRVAYQACKEMLDRGFGKPPQSVEFNGQLKVRHEDALDLLK